MAHVTIIGRGNMGQAIAGIVERAGGTVDLLGRDSDPEVRGDVVVLAVPYPAVPEVLGTYGAALDGKVVVDVTNPVDFATFDGLTVAPDGSAAAEIAAAVPGARVVKGFNTSFAGALAAGTVAGRPATVLLAGDDAEAKQTVADLVDGGGLHAVDAGSLRRARELEALGFLQITLAAADKTSWSEGFALA